MSYVPLCLVAYRRGSPPVYFPFVVFACLVFYNKPCFPFSLCVWALTPFLTVLVVVVTVTLLTTLTIGSSGIFSLTSLYRANLYISSFSLELTRILCKTW